ncbi:MAG: class I SAM-dependent methyltransferase [Chloroflexota bacterium]
MKCNLCGRDNWRVKFQATAKKTKRLDSEDFRCTCAEYGSHLQIVQCQHCGHVYANPRWEKGELLNVYEEVEDETYVAEQPGRKRTFTRHLHSIERFTGPANGRQLLDVGAYTGVFVETALEHGWQAIGIEPSRWAAEIAQKEGIPIIQGTLDAPELKDRRFEVITMWDVIEHLDDPTAELDKSFHLLEPGGLLAVHTMDIDSLVARLMGEHWPWLMDMHIHYFSRRTLTKFLEKSGFEVIWTGAQGRFLSLGYLSSRVSGLSRPLGRLIDGLVSSSGLKSVNVPVNFGDLITVFAIRPERCRPIAEQNVSKIDG